MTDPFILSFINFTHHTLTVQGYTEHGITHATIVAERSLMIAKKIGLTPREAELAAIAGFCHDMGNFVGRTQHHYWGGLLLATFLKDECAPEELPVLIQAISNHDKEEMKLSHSVAAVMIIADKSDVRRSRVVDASKQNLAMDIHDRVNYAVTDCHLSVNAQKKEISLKLKIDTSQIPIIEYFEIFTERMAYCRKAAQYLGYKFQLYINKFKLL